MSLFAGPPRPDESIATTDQLHIARYVPTRNIHILKGPLYLCKQKGILNWLANWNPDALIMEANPRYISTPATIRWMKRRGRPVIGWGLGTALAGRWRGIMRLFFLKQFDGLIAYSQRGAEEYKQLGFPADRIFVAPNAVTARTIHPMPSRPENFTSQPNILFVGRLQARKRVDNLLRACSALPEKIQPHLTIVGDGPERQNLEHLAKEIYPTAEFTGARHGEELKPYFLEADLFILPGTGGLAVQEAMSSGLPVIVAKGDGTQDDLVRPGNGWQIPDDDLPALTLTIHQALSNISRLRRMGAESYRIVAEEINIERMVAVFIETLNHLL
jgi:glycosyltransferase involved in cell wall biosynthesis